MSVLLAQQGSAGDLISVALETIQPMLEYLGVIAFAITCSPVAAMNAIAGEGGLPSTGDPGSIHRDDHQH